MKKTASRFAGLLLTLAITLTVSGWIPFTAPVTIHSSPEGAQVYKPGSDEPVGVTPFKTFVFHWGKEFEVRLDRFYTKPVQLDFNSPEDIYVTLKPQPVLVYTKPSAELYDADTNEKVGDLPMDVSVAIEPRGFVIKKDGYFSQNITIGLETENPQVIELQHRPLISISATPDNVDIYENGQFLSKAPLTEEISAPRTFEFRRAGYYSQTLTLTPQQTHELNYETSVALKELPVISIEAIPAHADIYMDGKEEPIGTGSVTLKIAETTGFTVKADRYYDEHFTVEATTSQKAPVVLEAMPYVTINSTPSGATVTINGRRIGTTPVEYLAEEPVSAVLSVDGYLPQTITVDANNLSPSITLEEEPPPPAPETNIAPVVVEEPKPEPKSTGLSPALIIGLAAALIALIVIIIIALRKKK